LALPAGGDGAVLPIEGAAGVETLVLLARDEPLSRNERLKFSGWLPPDRFPELKALPSPARPRWLTLRREESEQQEREEKEREQRQGKEDGRVRAVGQPRVPKDPLFQFETILRERLGPRFRLIQAVSFTNVGPKGEQQ
jgi:hypothetical protein